MLRRQPACVPVPCTVSTQPTGSAKCHGASGVCEFLHKPDNFQPIESDLEACTAVCSGMCTQHDGLSRRPPSFCQYLKKLWVAALLPVYPRGNLWFRFCGVSSTVPECTRTCLCSSAMHCNAGRAGCPHPPRQLIVAAHRSGHLFGTTPPGSTHGQDAGACFLFMHLSCKSGMRGLSLHGMSCSYPSDGKF